MERWASTHPPSPTWAEPPFETGGPLLASHSVLVKMRACGKILSARTALTSFPFQFHTRIYETKD
jgi:hypothetical protein